jgi:hypothetical protein
LLATVATAEAPAEAVAWKFAILDGRALSSALQSTRCFILQMGESVSCLPAISSSYFQDCGTAFAVCATPIPLHTVIVKALALSTVVPDGRDLGIFTHISGMLDDKEFAALRSG